MDPFKNEDEDTTVNQIDDENKMLKKFVKLLGLYHLLMIPLIVFFGNWLIKIADKLGSFFDMAIIDTGKNDFWMVPIIGIFFTLAVCSFRVWKTPAKVEWLQPIMFVHGITAASFLIYYFVDLPSFAYILGMVVELIVFLPTSYFWMKATR